MSQRRKIRLAGRGAAERQADAAAGLGMFQPQQFHPVVAPFDIGGDLRNQRHAVAVGDHLHDGGEAGGGERRAACAADAIARRRAERQCLIAQAMTVFQKDQPALIDIVGGNSRGVRARIGRGHRQQEQVFEQLQRFDVGLADRKREHRGIERAAS